MASLSAADLQRRHALEGAPDPFPSLDVSDSTPRKSRPQTNGNSFDNSESSFPSLAPSAPSKAKAPSAWGTGSGGIKKAPVKSVPVFSATLNMARVDLSKAGKDGKPVTLGEVMKDVMAKTKTRIEGSSQRTTGATTFHIKGDSENAIEAAHKQITALLSPHATYTVQAPISTIGTIIGPKGANLIRLRAETDNTVKVDIPRRETIAVPTEPSSNDGDDEEEPTIPITISGPQSLADGVRAEIAAMISVKKSKSTQRVRDVPVHVVPFIAAAKADFQSEDVTVAVHDKEREVVVSGEREAVGKAIDAIKARVKDLEENLDHISMSIPKRQHRLLTGKAAEDLMTATRCAVIPTKFDEPGDEIVIWGMPDDVANSLAAIVQQAKSQHTYQYALPGPLAYAKQIQTYLIHSSYLKNLLKRHTGVVAHISPPALAEKVGTHHIDFIGEKAAVDAASKELIELIRNLEGALRNVEIDWLVHKVIIGKNGKKIQQFQDQHNVLLVFPPENSESSNVLLVHDPLNLTATAPSPSQKQAHLDDVQKDLLKIAAEAADVKSKTIEVDSKWHSAVVGKSGTTLNAIIGEEKVLSIKVGNMAKLGPGAAPLGTNEILVRGPSAEVDRAIKEILKIVEDAKNDEIDSSYNVEFEIPREYVGRIVGSGGAGVNKLRDQLGVILDFSDDADEKEATTDGKASKKKAKSSAKCHVKITGRSQNVEEAKKRILAQVERLADETSETLKIPRALHASLIGPSGKYVLRLEEKFSVKITFPRDNDEANEGRAREVLKPDEVLLKGGKKGVAGAKAEILEAVEYEKDNNNTTKFTVPTRAVARILGKGGANINAIKDSTDAIVDIDRPTESESEVTNVTLRGTKKAIAAAKEAILAISEEVSDEVTETINIESKFHRNIIGAGGQHLRELVIAAGGPSDPRAQAGLIHFPRQGEPQDEVRLRGSKAVVNKLKAALEKIATEQRDRIVVGVAVPHSLHRALIGRNGANLNELQSRTGTTVQFPGSRSYAQIGEPSNPTDLEGANPDDIVKVAGPSANCQKVVAELASHKEKETKEGRPAKEPRAAQPTKTVSVPAKYHHAVSQHLFRSLRSIGATVDLPKAADKSAPKRPAPAASQGRIDQDEDDGVEWQVVPNYQDTDEAEEEWTFKGRDQAALDAAENLLNEALEHAKEASHVGYLTLADRSVFPRIVGAKGATVARLRAETGADITVGRDDNTIVIVGSEQSLQEAKDAILKIAESRPRDRY